ncbi:MAG: Altronate dehydratase [Firmicutes bacterium]|nr:Altronate dehydratase [Bacillota bacterium]
MSLLKIHAHDNVAVALVDVKSGAELQAGSTAIIVADNIAKGHKIALCDLRQGQNVIKYGFPIGHVTQDVKAGQWLHNQNIKTNLGDILEYSYEPMPPIEQSSRNDRSSFQGYRRQDGRIGVRNEIWVVPTVSCVNQTAQLVAKLGHDQVQDIANIDGVFAFTHPYGCSQLGEDHGTTQRILADLVNHPNAGGVLVIGLGCENNYIAEFKKVLGEYNPDRVKFLVTQDVEDEMAAGRQLVEELIGYAGRAKRESCPVSELVVGLKCGGSDGFSGITANPLLGSFSDKIIDCGASTVLTEVPEMFGAETLLMNRAKDKAVFDKTVKLINDFKTYFMSYNQPVYENPSPGNKAGGISTLEEKSLGCVQKGGRSTVVDVLGYGETVKTAGLNLLSGPGNDAVAATALAAAGCHIILFSTGRGTPLGTAVPTIKVASNSDLMKRKVHWMDFDAGRLLNGQSMEALTEEFFAYILAVASGKLTKSEEMGFREIAIFKNGVTL